VPDRHDSTSTPLGRNRLPRTCSNRFAGVTASNARAASRTERSDTAAIGSFSGISVSVVTARSTTRRERSSLIQRLPSESGCFRSTHFFGLTPVCGKLRRDRRLIQNDPSARRALYPRARRAPPRPGRPGRNRRSVRLCRTQRPRARPTVALAWPVHARTRIVRRRQTARFHHRRSRHRRPIRRPREIRRRIDCPTPAGRPPAGVADHLYRRISSLRATDENHDIDRKYVVHSDGEYAVDDVHINTCESHGSLLRPWFRPIAVSQKDTLTQYLRAFHSPRTISETRERSPQTRYSSDALRSTMCYTRAFGLV